MSHDANLATEAHTKAQNEPDKRRGHAPFRQISESRQILESQEQKTADSERSLP